MVVNIVHHEIIKIQDDSFDIFFMAVHVVLLAASLVRDGVAREKREKRGNLAGNGSNWIGLGIRGRAMGSRFTGAHALVHQAGRDDGRQGNSNAKQQGLEVLFIITSGVFNHRVDIHSLDMVIFNNG